MPLGTLRAALGMDGSPAPFSAQAARFDANEGYLAQVSLGTQTNWTVCCWARIAVDRNTWSTFLEIEYNVVGSGLHLQTRDDGVTLAVWDDSNGAEVAAGPTLEVGAWYFLAISVTGTSGLLYTRRETGTVTTTNFTTGLRNLNRLRIGRNHLTAEWLNGNIAALKLYTAGLSQADLLAESASYSAVRTAALVGHWKLSGNADASAGVALTGAGAVTWETGPPIPDSAGPTTVTATANLVAGAQLAADATRTTFSGIALSAGAQLTVGAAVVTPTSVSLQAGAQLTVDSAAVRPAAVALTASAQLSVPSSIVTRQATAALIAGASLLVSSRVATLSAVALQAGAQLVTSSTVVLLAAAALQAGAQLAVSAAETIRTAVAALTAGAQVYVDSVASGGASVALQAGAQLTTVSYVQVLPSAALQAGAQLNVAGIVVRQGSVALIVDAQLSVASRATTFAGLQLAAGASLSVASLGDALAVAALVAGAQLTMDTTRQTFVVAALAANAMLSANSLVEVSTAVSLVSAALLSTTGRTETTSSEVLGAAALLSAAFQVRAVSVVVALAAGARLDVDAIVGLILFTPVAVGIPEIVAPTMIVGAPVVLDGVVEPASEGDMVILMPQMIDPVIVGPPETV